VHCVLYLAYLAAGSGESSIFRALTIVLRVDFVVGPDVECRNIWTTWGHDAPFMSRLVRLINLDMAKSAL
jgi:hypothetical protein